MSAAIHGHLKHLSALFQLPNMYLCNKNVENCILMKTLMFLYFEHIYNLVEKPFSIAIRTKLKFLKMLQVEGRLKEICSFET